MSDLTWPALWIYMCLWVSTFTCLLALIRAVQNVADAINRKPKETTHEAE